MRMKKILLSILTICVMCFSLVACGDKQENITTVTADTSVVSEAEKATDVAEVKTEAITTETPTTEAATDKVTAIDIIKGITFALNNHENDTMTANITVTMTMSMAGYDPFKLSMNGKMKYCKTGSYMKSNTTMDLGESLGGEQKQEAEQYQIIDGNTLIQFDYDSESGRWTRSEMQNAVISNVISNITEDQFTSLEMTESDSVYTIIGKTTSSKLSKTMQSFAQTGMEEVPIVLTIIADKETKEFKTMTFKFDSFTTEQGLKTDDIVIVITNTGIESGNIIVPEEIVEKAIKVEAVTENIGNVDSMTAGAIYSAANDSLSVEKAYLEVYNIKQDDVCTISETGEISPCEGNEISKFIETFTTNLNNTSLEISDKTNGADHWLIKRYLVQANNGTYEQPVIHVFIVNKDGSEIELAP